MQIWKIDLDLLAEDEPEYQDWADRGAQAFCVHDIRPGEYNLIRNWMRSETLRGNSKLVKQRYHDGEYDRECVDLTVAFDHADDSDRFAKVWCHDVNDTIRELTDWLSFL